MRIRLTLIVLSAGLLPEFANAQLIQVERGYVRAPFVRVERRPGRRTRVRAPFVEYGGRQQQYQYPQSPGPSYQAPIEPTPVGPATTAAPTDVTEMDWQSLRQMVRAGEADLNGQLDQIAATEQFRSALQIGTLSRLLATDINVPPQGESRDHLQQILDAYDRARISPTYRSVAELSGFRTVQSALRELLTSAQERQRGRLIVAAGQLNASLGRMQNGLTWVDYLRLPDSVYGANDLAGNQGAMVEQPVEPSLDDLQPVLTRFHSVNGDPRYRAVSSRQEFQSTYHHLGEYVQLLGEPSPTIHEPPIPLEPIRSRASKRN